VRKGIIKLGQEGENGGERKLSSLSVLNDQWRKKRVGL
jgi:hypothetical protein